MNNQDLTQGPTLKHLSSLQSRYDKLLKDYEMAMKEYTAYTKTVNVELGSLGEFDKFAKTTNTPTSGRVDYTNPTGKDDVVEKELSTLLKTIKEEEGLVIQRNKVFWGSGKDKTIFTYSANACRTACQKRDTCSGASFIKKNSGSSKGGCYLRTGTGKVRTREGSVAIVNNFVVLVAKLQQLNTRLLNINKKIVDANTQWKVNDVDTWREATYRLEDKTTDRHNELLDQREILDEMMQQYDSIEAGRNDTSIGTTQSLLWYRIFILLLVFIVIAGFVIIFNIDIGFLTSIWLVIFVLWFLGFTYLALFSLIVYILYYIYSVPI
jgi:hypothetical protein